MNERRPFFLFLAKEEGRGREGGRKERRIEGSKEGRGAGRSLFFLFFVCTLFLISFR